MQKVNWYIRAVFYCCLLVLFACDKQGPELVEVKKLDNYPSGSGLSFYGKEFYIIGDDATGILKMDSAFKVTGTIPLFNSSETRIPKDSKHDIESIAVSRFNKQRLMLLPGSGSLAPYRNQLMVIDLANGEKKQYTLDTFYYRLQQEGLELNIEGAAAIPAFTLLANRGNKSFRKNYLVFTTGRFWENQTTATLKLIKIGIQSDTSSFTGISGLDYSYATDQLFLTASTENTSDSYHDGSIGKSYLWIINDISSKRRLDAINPDKIIDLEELDSRFKGHKIESVTIVTSSKKTKELVFVSDDDKGGTVLFRVLVNGSW